MNKSEMGEIIASRTNIPKMTVLRVLDQFENVTTDTLKAGEQVLLTGFLKFEPVDKPARTGRNPKSGESIELAAKRVVKVKAMATLQREVNDQ